ncbi:ubiquinone menaquinone biosynthesis methylase [Planomonospora sphaerica]|uniref:Ubiquinone menaquinone biosynthesis methylase n=1 Tax=Planomonospora sphaerica TaxID=161355 RepID=A0A171D1Q4_9ACTN|nr:heparinase II/III family protein [Planomonospora sphaerica]GAT67540.1 ubiquinone menaquinone biosynthesis methylase [Planomonospora sphaerica]
MRRRTRALVLPTALLLTCGAMVGTAQTAGADGTAAKRTAECQGDWLPATPTSADVMAGQVEFLGLPAVKVGKDVDWRTDPYRNRSWSMVFHSLRWMGRLVADYETNGDKAYLTRATEIAKDWVADNPRRGGGSPYAWQEHPIALRAPALVCLSKHVGESWLTRSLAEHASMLSDPRLYEKGHNHGIDQDIALLGIGCRYRRDEWSSLAIRRLTETVDLDVDSQGALREQAPRYATYVHDRLKVAMDDIKECGRKVPSSIEKRWESLKDFVAHSTQPNGFMVPIGDGGADVRPVGYDSPKKTVKVYGNGYVYGRTAWDKPEAAFYSIRFGPGTRYHGHEDHLGVTYYAQGRDVLVDAGFHSYENSGYRRWTMSPEAHNVPVVAGARFRPRTATALSRSSIGGDRQSFRLTDRAYGVPRTRSVLVNHGEDVMAVLDTVPKGSKVGNLWHFAPGLSVVSEGGGRVVVKDKTGWKATLVQLAMPACTPVGGQKVVRGASSPYQGWVSTAYLKKEAAPAVVSPAVAGGLLTVVVPGTDRPSVSCSGGRVRLETSDGSVSFKAGRADLS